jgi:cell division protein FtsW (lipid II flippase)
MGVTYTTAIERRELSRTRTLQDTSTAELSLVAVSVLTVLMLLLTCQSRFRILAMADADARGTVVNLNGAIDSASLEHAFTPVLETAADRKLAARELLTFLGQEGGTRRVLPNVGALAKARVPAAAIDASMAAVGYRERLRLERERATTAGIPAPTSLSLFTSAELAAVKPSLVVRDRGAFLRALLIWGAVYVGAFHAVSLLWRARRIRGDRILLTAAHLLTAIGFVAMVSRPDPVRDLLLFVRYAQGIVVGLAVGAAVSLIRMRTAPLRQFSYLPLLGAVVISCALVVFGGGPAGSRARVNLGPVQPIEFIRLLLAFFLAGYFASRWELLRAVRAEAFRGVAVPRWLNVPHVAYALPVILGVFAALALFFIQRDLGPALMLAVVFLTSYAIARGTVGLAIAGALLLAAGFYLGYELEVSSTLVDRVRMWQAPWDNAARGGDQVAQALWAMAAGGPFGTGAGLGDTRYLPAGHTDLILAAIAEDLGIVPGARARAVPHSPGAVDGGRRDGPRAVDRSRDAVSQLRRFGDGRELRRARSPRGHSIGRDRDLRSHGLPRSVAMDGRYRVSRWPRHSRDRRARSGPARRRVPRAAASRDSGRRDAAVPVQPARD